MAVQEFFGSDTACLTDLSEIDVQIQDPVRLIGERIARRWQTQRGALASINGDPDFGLDVTQLVNAKMTPNDRQTAQAALAQEAEKDQQVDTCTVTISVGSGGAISVVGRFTTPAGPFSLTLDVRDLVVEDVMFSGGTGV
jgi:hypothetical protein